MIADHDAIRVAAPLIATERDALAAEVERLTAERDAATAHAMQLSRYLDAARAEVERLKGWAEATASALLSARARVADLEAQLAAERKASAEALWGAAGELSKHAVDADRLRAELAEYILANRHLGRREEDLEPEVERLRKTLAGVQKDLQRIDAGDTTITPEDIAFAISYILRNPAPGAAVIPGADTTEGS